MAPITQDQVRRLGLPTSDGVIITAVDRNSVAEDANIDEGWVITRIAAQGMQRMDVHNIDDFRKAEKLFKAGSTVALFVLRPQRNVYANDIVTIQIP